MKDSSDRPCILVANDDGIDAPGIAALAGAVAGLGRVVVVAPDRERSAAGHALTLTRPLRVTKLDEGRFEIDGTPTDCVHLGVFNLTGGRVPALVVSGINRGANVGDDVTYSGTVAAALEGCLLHVPSIAFSVERDAEGRAEYGAAAAIATRVAAAALAHGLPPGVLLNVNVPKGEPRGIRMTRQGTRTYRAAAVERLDPAGRPYFWIAGADTTPASEAGSDHAALRDGYVSITPLHANMTHEPSRPLIESWGLTLS